MGAVPETTGGHAVNKCGCTAEVNMGVVLLHQTHCETGGAT